MDMPKDMFKIIDSFFRVGLNRKKKQDDNKTFIFLHDTHGYLALNLPSKLNGIPIMALRAFPKNIV